MQELGVDAIIQDVIIRSSAAFSPLARRRQQPRAGERRPASCQT